MDMTHRAQSKHFILPPLLSLTLRSSVGSTHNLSASKSSQAPGCDRGGPVAHLLVLRL